MLKDMTVNQLWGLIANIAKFLEQHDYSTTLKQTDLTAKAIADIGDALSDIYKEKGWTDSMIIAQLDPDILSESFYKKIKDGTAVRIGAKHLFELRRITGLSLNKLAGMPDSLNNIKIGQMSPIRLLDISEQLYREVRLKSKV